MISDYSIKLEVNPLILAGRSNVTNAVNIPDDVRGKFIDAVKMSVFCQSLGTSEIITPLTFLGALRIDADRFPITTGNLHVFTKPISCPSDAAITFNAQSLLCIPQNAVGSISFTVNWEILYSDRDKKNIPNIYV